MGFLEYAWSLFFEKDWLKTKILASKSFQFPQLLLDNSEFVCIFPEPVLMENEEKRISLMGYEFPNNEDGKNQLISVFRASVFHLASHVFSSKFEDYAPWSKKKNQRLAKFVSSLIEDIQAASYIRAKYPDKLVDAAFANTLALRRMRKANRFVNPTVNVMTDLLLKTHTGVSTAKSGDVKGVAASLGAIIDEFRKDSEASMQKEPVNIIKRKLEVADNIYREIYDIGVVTEIPFLPHTEEPDQRFAFSRFYVVPQDIMFGDDFRKCSEFLGVPLRASTDADKILGKVMSAEAAQVFDSWRSQKEKDKKIMSKYEKLLPSTSFKSVGIPEEDYSEYLRVKARSRSEAHRLVESILVARDAIDEDPRKMYGVLDLQEVIQVIASKSPRMDVFMLDENLSKSYSWIILLDASRSMGCIKNFAMDVLLILAEAANETLIDPTSWGVYAFNDRFYVIKDLTERYNVRIRSRIGGIRFEGTTYLPDALSIAGKVIRSRAENMRLIAVISDGWPCGYSGMDAKLSETINMLRENSVSLLGIGTKSRRMDSFLKSHCSVYTLRDLTKKFSNLYIETSNSASEA